MVAQTITPDRPDSLSKEAIISQIAKLEASFMEIQDEYLRIKLADGIAAHTQNVELQEISRDMKQQANKRLIELLDQAVESRLDAILETARVEVARGEKWLECR